MQRLKEWHPSAFDSRSNLLASKEYYDVQDWFMLASTTRDADLLTTSNWEVIQKELEPFTDQWEIHGFNHWVCGWVDVLVVKPDSEAYQVALEILTRLENYPILDEDDFSQQELAEHTEYHSDWSSDCSLCTDEEEQFRDMVISAYEIALTESLRKAARIKARYNHIITENPVVYWNSGSMRVQPNNKQRNKLVT